jgi:phospholipase C
MKTAPRTAIALASALAAVAVACSGGGGNGARVNPDSTLRSGSAPAVYSTDGITKIKHIIVVMQENRSFDNYFGTFPGADGIPMHNGVPTVCVPVPNIAGCARPYHDTSLIDGGGPHNLGAAERDIHGGAMDGFARSAVAGRMKACDHPTVNPVCTGATTPGDVPDVLGYHTAAEIPNYWSYARNFVLQDHMFAGVNSWSLPAHLDMVSGWSAKCSDTADPMTCVTNIDRPGRAIAGATAQPPYAWTDLTYVLDRAGVSWRYFVQAGSQPDCTDPADMICPPQWQSHLAPDSWNPLPGFADVQQDGQLRDVTSPTNYFRMARRGSLPSVSWIVPNGRNSEHPPASIANGQAWVTKVIDAAMRSPDWKSTAIFLSWDDWGGFYDNVPPPALNPQGLGMRVPGLVISPYAQRGMIDHQTLSTDSYLRFIEDDFLGGQRIDPATDGRPDARPFVAENTPGVGNLLADFNFTQKPLPPLILAPRPDGGHRTGTRARARAVSRISRSGTPTP